MLHFCRSPDEFPEYRMRPVRPGFEFRMILHAKEKGMIFQLHGFHQQSVRRYTGDDKTLLLQYIAVIVVKLIAVAVPFPDFLFPSVTARHQRPGKNAAWITPQPERSPFIGLV